MTKKNKKNKKKNTECWSIVIPKAVTDQFLKLPHKDRSNAMALYWFYYYTATWQETNRTYCTDSYVTGIVKGKDERKGLGWCLGKVARIRKILESMGLITRVKDGVTGKAYIKINYYHSKQAVRDAEARAIAEESVDRAEKPNKVNSRFPRLRYSRARIVNSRKANSRKTSTNTYSNNTLNSYKSNTVACKQDAREIEVKDVVKKDCYEKYAIKLETLLQKKYGIKKANMKNWAKQFELLYTKDDIKKSEIKSVLTWYKNNIGGKFVPDPRCAKSFREKFDKIKAAIKRDDDKIAKGEKDIVYRVKRC